ncbi:MAG: hypothetical protein WA946_07885 [Nitrospirota bacterium]
MQRILQVVLAMVLLAPMAAWTQQKSAIALKSVAEVEIAEKNEKGEKVIKRVDVAKAAATVPGDTVVFTTHYTNTGKQPATDVVITNPVDKNMTYLDNSAEGSNTRIEFSTDGGKTYSAPEKLMVKNAQGMVRQAGAEDYTGIRWTLTKPLTAGGTGSVSFKARIK